MNDITLDKTGWKKYRFDEVCRQVNEATKDPAAEGLDHVIGLEHIEPNNLHITQWDTLEKETTFTRKFKKGQVLFGRRRAYQRKVAYAEFDGICSGDILVFEAIEEVMLPELLPFVIQSEGFFQKALETSAGSLSPRTKFKELADYEFLLPPKPEQKRLAALLWSADKMIEKEKMELEKLRLHTSALSTSLFHTKKKTTRKLIDIANITMGQSPIGSSYNEQQQGMPFLQGNSEFTDLYPCSNKYTTQPTKIAQAGDILMSVRAPVGAINIADKPYCIGRGLCALSAKDGDNDYLKFLLQSMLPEFERISTGSTFKAINSDDLKKMDVPNEKKDISLLLKNEEVISIIEKQLYHSQQLKQELINKVY
ncbi:MAG: restriction endonuclease subunit S [Bacteroidales bacterium]|nr:restriction endonuclease subunit S [Bacteroidales bacterium]